MKLKTLFHPTRKKKSPPTNKNILPEGYYSVICVESVFGSPGQENFDVAIKQGPFAGITFSLADKVKIFDDVLTGTPQLCYDYKILDYGSFEPVDVESSVILSRIIAAIAVEVLYDEIGNGAVIESV